ncbi:MAG: hypothetical protein RL268_172 [Pseudomonadota bacterium]|jgi:hypothetical protein
MTGLIIGIGAILVICVLWLVWEARRAPLGWQDKDGNWHFEERGE